ncbi:hypothetical protein chiPu_0023853 [Chiloscyllium punctatum]|uniref:Uncharacterized protein n=1 Tax=Chiloscyllium punctatum TaxID=137246 RepID=A0A401TAD5_CHIPU|nr:hypothetical protein [Chiloscyllium punctatum]
MEAVEGLTDNRAPSGSDPDPDPDPSEALYPRPLLAGMEREDGGVRQSRDLDLILGRFTVLCIQLEHVFKIFSMWEAAAVISAQ